MGRATAPRQLVLALPHAESFARDDFVAGTSNRAALSLVDRWPDWPGNVVMLVGPEGDFTPAELALARRHGCQPITLGPIILRVETAAIYCLSVLSYELLI